MIISQIYVSLLQTFLYKNILKEVRRSNSLHWHIRDCAQIIFPQCSVVITSAKDLVRFHVSVSWFWVSHELLRTMSFCEQT